MSDDAQRIVTAARGTMVPVSMARLGAVTMLKYR